MDRKSWGPSLDPDGRSSGAIPGGGAASPLACEDRETLREVAHDSIRIGLSEDHPLRLDPAEFAVALQRPGASFVTLTSGGRLRGCVGSLEAVRSVVEDVARNAYGAAFQDYRFPPLSPGELGGVEVKISLLSPLEPLHVEGREALLLALRPGIDGLVLDDPPHRATFLPQVWSSLPDPEAFLNELMAKAGLPRDHWSPTLRLHRYAVEEF